MPEYLKTFVGYDDEGFHETKCLLFENDEHLAQDDKRNDEKIYHLVPVNPAVLEVLKMKTDLATFNPGI